ncbi:MAG TPA: hypothetical protein VFK06_07070 [Candidatus Angelobacter sp.]|nr:hypothetical protein [Candidatus Angelobacter sp.]
MLVRRLDSWGRSVTDLLATLQKLLYGISPTDPGNLGRGRYTQVGVLMMMVTLLPWYLPAHRATQLDPLVAKE